MPFTELLGTPLPERSLYPFPIKITVYQYHVRCQVGRALRFLNRQAALLKTLKTLLKFVSRTLVLLKLVLLTLVLSTSLLFLLGLLAQH